MIGEKIDQFPGVYRAVVKSNKDPQNRNRLQISVDHIHGGNEIWAMPCLPMASWTEHTPHGNHAVTEGSLIHTHNHDAHQKLPDVGMGVWVMFEAADPEKPVWLGVWQTPAGGQ